MLADVSLPFVADDDPATAQLLAEAAAHRPRGSHTEQLLWRALSGAKDKSAVYFALYKFYFYQGMLHDAETVARRALENSAQSAGFASDWRVLEYDQLKQAKPGQPAYFLLFTLKALAFIRLRLGDREECRALLEKLKQLDPGDRVGASVIVALLENTR